MKGFFGLAILSVLLALALAQTATPIGTCQFVGTVNDPNIVGSVVFTKEMNGNILMTVEVSGITQNTGVPHGIHIHQYGDISNRTGASVGDHWNPLNQEHSCPEPRAERQNFNDNRHAGDTGNWDVSAEGTITGSKSLNIVDLNGNFSIIGHAVVLHNTTDNCVDVSSSGARLAFCVIGLANPGTGNNNTAASEPEVPVKRAVCDLSTTTDAGATPVTGRVLFVQEDNGSVTVTAVINGISTPHGMHIHQFGDISDVAAASKAGGHFNPYGQNHSIPDIADRHVGDMGNINAFQGNVGYYQHTFTDLIKLNGLNNVIGRAVILHETRDNCSQPIGFSGKRYAQCVIGIASDTVAALDFNGATPSTIQDTTGCEGVPPVTDTTTTGSEATTGQATTGATTGPATTGSDSTTGDEYSSSALRNVVATLLIVVLIALVF